MSDHQSDFDEPWKLQVEPEEINDLGGDEDPIPEKPF